VAVLPLLPSTLLRFDGVVYTDSELDQKKELATFMRHAQESVGEDLE
jgi:hypothetical protein